MKFRSFAIFLILFLSFVADVEAQACGSISLKIFLKDSNGRTIKNAEIETFDKEFKEASFPFDRAILWSEKDQSYYGFQSLGGTAYGTGVRISAEGFETFEKVIDLPFGWHAYSVTLKAKESNEISKISRLSVISGTISNTSGQRINKSKVTVFDKEKRIVYSDENSNGYYWLFLPKGRYDLEFAADGYKVTFIKGFEVSDKENKKSSKDKKLNLTLEFMGIK